MRRHIVIPDLSKRNRDVSAFDGTKPRECNFELR
jgi:hypothetical protein